MQTADNIKPCYPLFRDDDYKKSLSDKRALFEEGGKGVGGLKAGERKRHVGRRGYAVGEKLERCGEFVCCERLVGFVAAVFHDQQIVRERELHGLPVGIALPDVGNRREKQRIARIEERKLHQHRIELARLDVVLHSKRGDRADGLAHQQRVRLQARGTVREARL